MWLNNARKVALVTAGCCLAQGYVFEYVLGVQPHPMIIFAPLLILMGYLFMRRRLSVEYRDPYLWILGILLISLSGLGFYAITLH